MNDPLWLELGPRRYPIYIEDDFTGLADAFAAAGITGAVFAVTDENTDGLFRCALQAACPKALFYSVAKGEGSKSFAVYQALCEWLLANGLQRDSAVVALGGGVVGDLAGFAAATVMRGVKFVQLPTSLLAQVDSAVGGKTGINAAGGKNLIGSFYQPALVYTALDTLKSLPVREMRAGYAEILKYAVLGDAAFFDGLEESAGAILTGAPTACRRAIEISCRMKADIVARDEHEAGARALLNLGHSFGHALEAIAGYDGRLLHGEAILIGMDMAAAYAHRRGFCGVETVERLRAHYQRYGLWPDYDMIGATPEAMMTHMMKDKKNSGAGVTLILPERLGQAVIRRGEAPAAITAFLTDYLER